MSTSQGRNRIASVAVALALACGSTQVSSLPEDPGVGAAAGTSARAGASGAAGADGDLEGGASALGEAGAGGMQATAGSGAEANGGRANPTGGASSAGAGASGGSTGVAGGPPVGACVAKTHVGDVSATTDQSLQRLAGVTNLEGNLAITSSVKDLTPLACLSRIRGDLVLSGTRLSVATLPSLTEIGGRINAVNLPTLTELQLPLLAIVGSVTPQTLTLDTLPALRRVSIPALKQTPAGVGLTINNAARSSPSLQVELGSLLVVGGDVTLLGNGNLRDLAGLPLLRTISGRVLVANNDGLASTDGLVALEQIGGTLTLQSNPALTQVRLKSLQRIGGQLSVNGNDALVGVELRALTAIGRELLVERNAKLATVDLRALVSIRAAASSTPSLPRVILFDTLPALVSIDLRALPGKVGPTLIARSGAAASGDLGLSFDSVTQLDLELVELANLVHPGRFSALSRLDSLKVASNPRLVDLAGFESLTAISLRLTITDDPMLRSIDLRGVQELAEVTLSNLPLLAELDLRSVGAISVFDGVRITSCGASTSTPLRIDFRSLTSISAFFATGVANLEQIGSFPALARGTRLDVRNNPRLVSLAGMPLLNRLSILSVVDNGVLPTCQATAIRDRLVVSSLPPTVTISGNLSDGCSN